MNRPEPIELENNLGPDAVTGEINRVPWKAYDVDEMDIYIAEKDKEIESLKASHYAESVDAGMRERRLKRALYKACANWAHAELMWASLLDFKCPEDWDEMERKCRAKAEQYK